MPDTDTRKTAEEVRMQIVRLQQEASAPVPKDCARPLRSNFNECAALATKAIEAFLRAVSG